MSIFRTVKILGARWPTNPTEAELPAIGTGEGYVPTLQDDNTIKWREGGSAGGRWAAMVSGDASTEPEIVFILDELGAADMLEFWIEND